MAARCVLVTVEEQVERLPAASNAVVLPAWLISAASLVPGGAYPSYAHGYYPRDNAFYLSWDSLARERATFLDWMQQHVLGVPDHATLLRKVGVAT
jgi:glutaconate CoA-transferase subunit A